MEETDSACIALVFMMHCVDKVGYMVMVVEIMSTDPTCQLSSTVSIQYLAF